MLKQSHKEKFDIGYDSIIFKSALISESKSLNNKVYNNDVGYGIPNYYKIKEALSNLVYFNNIKETKTHYLRFNKGDSIRINASWLSKKHNSSNKDDDINLYVYDSNSKLVASSRSLSKNTETVEFNVNNDETYRIELNVRHKTPNIRTDVALTYAKNK